VSKAKQLPGSVDDATTARGMFVKHFEDAWVDVSEAGGKTEAMENILKGMDDRSTALVKGVPFGNTWSLDKRKKLMFAALVGSYIAMDTDANLEKYATCGSGTMCLHFPLFFGKDNNLAYGLGEEVMSDYKGLVVTKYPGAKRDRFHLMSPCKTDLVVEAHEDDGFCKCEELYTADEVVYRMQKIRCMAKGVNLPIPINADGTCPEKYTYAGTEYEVVLESDEVDTHVAGDETFSCDPDADLDACVPDFMYRDGCTNLDPIFCLYEEYKDCYFADCPNPSSFCFNDPGGLCDTDGNCVGFTNKPSYTVPLSNTQDTFAVPVNLKENVNEDGLKAFEPVTVCTNSWASDLLGSTDPYIFYPCVSVAYDTVSMRGYSKGGFGVNYCAENKADFKDTLEKTCFWDGIVGAAAVSAFSGSVTGTVLLPVAIGSGSVACEKIMNMESKWPQDQH
jgi:hypothetical protein